MRVRKSWLPVVFLILAFCASLANSGASQSPNIIFFLSDDHRADVLGCAGHPIVQTPNIDKLAEGGIRYSNAFVTTSICAASRATIFTGLVERTHAYTFGKPPLSTNITTNSYPTRLKSAGYRTGFVGKFGVRVEGGQASIDEMFDSFVPLSRSGSEKNSKGTSRHFTDLAGDRAIDFIAQNPKGKPFCLSVSFHAAHAEDGDMLNHYPYPQSEENLYSEVIMPRPKLDGGLSFDSQPKYLQESMNRDRYSWRWDTPEKYDRNLRNYFRMLTGMDRNIGRVMNELQSRGLGKTTVIIFMGDNGYYMGERGFAGKWSHFEESLRVPLVIFDPRKSSSANRVQTEIALNLDIAPTILRLAGLGVPKSYQGFALPRSAETPARDGFFCEHRMDNPRIPKWEGYRGKRFVYANYYEQTTAAEFLHDLRNDPDQLKNLVEDPAYEQTLSMMRATTLQLSHRYEAAK
jgi:arylsulfatase A-like enzyme